MAVFQELQGVSFPNDLPLLVKDPLVTLGTLHLLDVTRTTCWDGSAPTNLDVFNDLSLDGENNGTFKGDGATYNDGIDFLAVGASVPRIDLPDIALHNKSFIAIIWVKPTTQGSGTMSYFGRANSDTDLQFNLKKLINNNVNVRFNDSIGNFTQLGFTVPTTVPTQIAFSVEIVGGSTTVVKLYKNNVLVSTVERAQGAGLIEWNTYNPAINAWGNSGFFDDNTNKFYRSLIEDLDVSGRTPEEVLALDYTTNVNRFT